MGMIFLGNPNARSSTRVTQVEKDIVKAALGEVADRERLAAALRASAQAMIGPPTANTASEKESDKPTSTNTAAEKESDKPTPTTDSAAEKESEDPDEPAEYKQIRLMSARLRSKFPNRITYVIKCYGNCGLTLEEHGIFCLDCSEETDLPSDEDDVHSQTINYENELPLVERECGGYKCRNDGWTYEQTGIWCISCHGSYVDYLRSTGRKLVPIQTDK